MIEEPHIKQATARPAAVLPLTVPRAEIRNVMGAGMQELMATVAAQGLAIAGPMFSHHHRMDPAVFDLEIGVPVVGTVQPAGPESGRDPAKWRTELNRPLTRRA